MQLVTCGSESMAPVVEVSMSRVVLWRARRLERQYPILSWADAELRHQAGRRQPHGGTWTRPAGAAGGGDRRRRNLLMLCII